MIFLIIREIENCAKSNKIRKTQFEVQIRPQWDGVRVPVQAQTKRLQKIPPPPPLVFWSVGLGMKFLKKFFTQV